MSQIAKRHATDAFDDDSTGTPSKRRRTRKRLNHEASAANVHSQQVASSSAGLEQRTPTKKSSRVKPDDSLKPTSKPDAEGKALVPERRKRIRGQHGDKKAKDIRSKDKAEERPSTMTPWTLSVTSGGVFIDHDPIFTRDKKCVIIFTRTDINVYSMSTSLLIRSIHIRERDTISSCCISSTDQHIIFAATRRGYIFALDWTTGSKITKWQTSSGLKSIASTNGTPSGDVLLAIRSKDDKHDELLQISTARTHKNAATTSLLQTSHLHNAIMTSPDASVVVVCGRSVAYIGYTNVEHQAKKKQQQSYTWHHLPVTSSVTSFDTRFVPSQNKSDKASWAVDVVVGHDNGSILVYDNILFKLLQKSKESQKIDLNGRKLHWHRSLVRSVKWSRDGNYLVSGGDETVLVIWQLETNQQQYLPHLSSPILNIQISQSGAEYGLRLGDNSVMVLSTADLSPMTNVAGLSLPSNRDEMTPLLLHPADSNRLLAAVSLKSIGSSKFSSSAATHLQTFDIDTNLQLYRQALTRNVTTAVNVAPTGQIIQEPSVTHLQISYDGQWLMTVDKWSPNALDMQALYLNEDDQSAKQSMTETLLRFWSWNADDGSWEVVSRVEEPHQTSRFSIIEVASNPTTSEFSTLGEDGKVKIWRPRKRVRDGVQIRDKSGRFLYNWTCAHTVQIEPNRIDGTVPSQPSGTMTYSQDGSVLAASRSSQQRSVHFVDPRIGALRASQPNLLAEGPASMAMTGRSLLCLSNDLKVFDMITSHVTLTVSLASHHRSFMTVNSGSNTIALGLNPQERHSPAVISIFDLDRLDHGAIRNVETPSQIRALLPERSNGGFVLIDNECRVRKLLPPNGASAASLALTIPSQALGDQTQKSFEDVFRVDWARTTQQQPKMIEHGGERSQSLSELVSAPSTSSQLGINELFDRVSRAMSGARVAVGA